MSRGKINKNIDPTFFRLKVEDILELPDEDDNEEMTNEQRINGFPIIVRLRQKKEFGVGGELRAGIDCIRYDICEDDECSNFFFNASVDFKLVNFIDDSKSKCVTVDSHLSAEESAYDFHLIDWDEVINEEKGFIRNGAIILEAKVTSGRCGLYSLPSYYFTVPSDLSDVVLVVGKYKLHVSKQILAHHSSYFKSLFYGNFKESNQSEIVLKDLASVNFINLLELIYGDKSRLNESMPFMKKILPLLDRFDCERLRYDVQLSIANRQIPYKTKLALSSEYRLNYLQDHCMFKLDTAAKIRTVMSSNEYHNLSDDIKEELQRKMESFPVGAGKRARMNGEAPEIPSPTFDFSSPSEITDVVLVVEGQKLHVGKQILAHHSSYFKNLFSGDLKKSHNSEIDLEDLLHEDFLILLNLIYGDRKQMNSAHMKQLIPLLVRFECKGLTYDAQMCMIGEFRAPIETKISLADEYQLHFLLDDCITKLNESTKIKALMTTEVYGKLKEEIKKELEKKIGTLEKSEKVMNDRISNLMNAYGLNSR